LKLKERKEEIEELGLRRKSSRELKKERKRDRKRERERVRVMA